MSRATAFVVIGPRQIGKPIGLVHLIRSMYSSKKVRAGFERKILRAKGAESTNEPLRPTNDNDNVDDDWYIADGPNGADGDDDFDDDDLDTIITFEIHVDMTSRWRL